MCSAQQKVDVCYVTSFLAAKEAARNRMASSQEDDRKRMLALRRMENAKAASRVALAEESGLFWGRSWLRLTRLRAAFTDRFTGRGRELILSALQLSQIGPSGASHRY